MKSQGELLGEIASLLDAAQVRYMVTGSIASTYHGRPRATQDVDVVVETGSSPNENGTGSGIDRSGNGLSQVTDMCRAAYRRVVRRVRLGSPQPGWVSFG